MSQIDQSVITSYSIAVLSHDSEVPFPKTDAECNETAKHLREAGVPDVIASQWTLAAKRVVVLEENLREAMQKAERTIQRAREKLDNQYHVTVGFGSSGIMLAGEAAEVDILAELWEQAARHLSGMTAVVRKWDAE